MFSDSNEMWFREKNAGFSGYIFDGLSFKVKDLCILAARAHRLAGKNGTVYHPLSSFGIAWDPDSRKDEWAAAEREWKKEKEEFLATVQETDRI